MSHDQGCMSRIPEATPIILTAAERAELSFEKSQVKAVDNDGADAAAAHQNWYAAAVERIVTWPCRRTTWQRVS